MESPNQKYKIVIADPQPIARFGLARLIQDIRPEWEISECGDGPEVIELCIRLHPEILLLDLAMPKISGLDIICRVKESSPDTRILVFTANQRPEIASLLIEAGIDGLLTRFAPVGQIVSGISALEQGVSYFLQSARLGGAGGVQNNSSIEPHSDGYESLTHREQKVFQLVAQGKTTREIARMMSIREKTVENHRLRLMRKLKLRRTAEVVRYAALNGFLT